MLCSYSTGLYAQAFVPRIRRSVSVLIVGVVAAVLAAYLLYGAPAFLDTLSYAIEIAVAVMGPLVAIYAIDIVLRRGRYDGLALNDTSRNSPFWYSRGWFLPGVAAMLVATTVAVLMVNTTLYTRPHFDGARWSGSVVARGPRARCRAVRASLAHDATVSRPRRAARPRVGRRPETRMRSSAAATKMRASPLRPRRPREEWTMTWTMPAEFAPQERVWMAFPRVGNTLGDDAAVRRSRRVTPGRPWRTRRPGSSRSRWSSTRPRVAEARKRLSGEIELVEAPLDDYWMRDIGPTFVVDEDGALGAVDWTFNGWGANAWATWERDNRIARTVAELAGAAHLPSPLVNEGGGIHVDGEGTVLLTETVQLDPRRNPYATKERVEWELQRTIGATTFIWLPRGLTRDYESAGTRGHVDMVATFAEPGRVLLHWQDDPSHPDYQVVRQVRAVLEQATDAAGRASRDHRAARARDAARRGRLRRLELREPPGRQRRRDRVRLRRAGADARAAAILGDAYGRDVVTIDARPILAAGRRHPLHHPAAAEGGRRAFRPSTSAARSEPPGADTRSPSSRRPIAELRDRARVRARPRASSSSRPTSPASRRTTRAASVSTALVELNPDALAEAEASDRRRAEGATLGPLDGIPYTAKDSYMVRGMTVASGSPAFADLVARRDAFSIERLRGAGCVLIGLTNMPPMANGGMQRGLYGRAESPYNADYLTSAFGSGSSNGSGTATAASFAAFGLGEETWSSGRAPASNNALCAYTPSRGVISVRGNWPLVPTMDVVVPHTRTMADLLEVLDVIVADDADTRGDFWRSQPWVPIPALVGGATGVVPGAGRRRRRQPRRQAVRHPGDVSRRRSGCRHRARHRSLDRPAHRAAPVGARAVGAGEGRPRGGRRRGRRGRLPRREQLRGRPRAGHRRSSIAASCRPTYFDAEIWDLSMWSWHDFLAANGQPGLSSLAEVDGAKIFPHPEGALPDRYGSFDLDISEYVTRARANGIDRPARRPARRAHPRRSRGSRAHPAHRPGGVDDRRSASTRWSSPPSPTSGRPTPT